MNLLDCCVLTISSHFFMLGNGNKVVKIMFIFIFLQISSEL